MQTPEEIYLRKKIRENHSVPINFYLQHFNHLNAEEVLRWLEEYSSQLKDKLENSHFIILDRMKFSCSPKPNIIVPSVNHSFEANMLIQIVLKSE